MCLYVWQLSIALDSARPREEEVVHFSSYSLDRAELMRTMLPRMRLNDNVRYAGALYRVPILSRLILAQVINVLILLFLSRVNATSIGKFCANTHFYAQLTQSGYKFKKVARFLKLASVSD